jgi:hypothetical protein
MLSSRGGWDHHDRFRELSALSVSGNLSPLEMSELHLHLQDCDECRELVEEYRVLATQGMAALAETFGEERETVWEAELAREELLERVRADQRVQAQIAAVPSNGIHGGILGRVTSNRFIPFALAAGLLLAAGYGGYSLGTRSRTPASISFTPVSDNGQLQKLSAEKAEADALLATQANELASLQQQSAEKERELAKLRVALREAEGRSNELGAANGQADEKLRSALQERDTLTAQLQAASQSYEKDRADLAKLRAEHDGTLIRTSSLETRINELSATNRDQERRLKEAEQYLSSDRDIRELMGARKLYIADVFDVDGSSRTQRPFGRVFYTQGKSLIFYAFDLDRQPKVVNASTFQVWGQREAPQGEQVLPMNLGILYLDNEANRRWVMRFDDPKQLSEIDAVFVTVEPHGGSSKPTSKPFLYALLRNQANHP